MVVVHDHSFYIYSFSPSSSSTRTWLDEVRCLGTEIRLIDCPANTIGVEDCTHIQDVALVCIHSINNGVSKLLYNYSVCSLKELNLRYVYK